MFFVSAKDVNQLLIVPVGNTKIWDKTTVFQYLTLTPLHLYSLDKAHWFSDSFKMEKRNTFLSFFSCNCSYLEMEWKIVLFSSTDYLVRQLVYHKTLDLLDCFHIDGDSGHGLKMDWLCPTSHMTKFYKSFVSRWIRFYYFGNEKCLYSYDALTNY